MPRLARFLPLYHPKLAVLCGVPSSFFNVHVPESWHASPILPSADGVLSAAVQLTQQPQAFSWAFCGIGQGFRFNLYKCWKETPHLMILFLLWFAPSVPHTVD
jgi:hypothetical protein